jgi:hypothetical protein
VEQETRMKQLLSRAAGDAVLPPTGLLLGLCFHAEDAGNMLPEATDHRALYHITKNSSSTSQVGARPKL